MQTVRRARLLLAGLLFVLCIVFASAPHLCALFLMSRLARDAPAARRKRLARWQSDWALVGLWLCRTIGGVRVRFLLDARVEEKRTRPPFIVIGNHYGVIDGLLIARVLRRLGGADFRPVAKSQTSSIPLMGRVWKELGIAFVKRDHRKSDVDAVASLAALAHEDGASVIIFPEGTVLSREKAVDGNRTLLPPKLGGFRRLTKYLPDYPILSLTFHWRRYAPSFLSDEGYLPPGSDVVVDCRLLDPVPTEDADRTLTAEWERKAAWLRASP